MIDYIKGAQLQRSYDYIKVHGDEDHDEYQACMVIKRESAPGRSFIITLDALWKYDEPFHNQEPRLVEADKRDFQVIIDRTRFRKGVAVGYSDKMAVAQDEIAIALAHQLFRINKILLCTGYNLIKCAQILDLPLSGPAAAQLLMWIQDGLDYLKNMPPHEAEPDIPAGELTLWEGGTKIATKEIGVTEDDFMEGRGHAGNLH